MAHAFARSSALLAALPLVLFAAGALPAQGSTKYDLGAGWSDTQNPRGVWSYDAGSHPITNHVPSWQAAAFQGAQPAWAAAASGFGHIPTWFKQQAPWATGLGYDTQIGDVLMHGNDPANGNDIDHANVKWTSPTTANAHITGSVWMIRNLGRSMTWTLSLNGAVLAQGSLPGTFTRANPATFDVTRAVVPGDVVELEFVRTSMFGDLSGVVLAVEVDRRAGNFELYGQGCGPGIGNQGLPKLGSAFSVLLFRGQPSSAGVLFLGAQPLALDLSSIKMPGCTLLTSTEVPLPITTDGSGRAALGLSVPGSAALLGGAFYNQFFVASPGANGLGVVGTDGGKGTIGS